jgi:hypothetical protein
MKLKTIFDDLKKRFGISILIFAVGISVILFKLYNIYKLIMTYFYGEFDCIDNYIVLMCGAGNQKCQQDIQFVMRLAENLLSIGIALSSMKYKWTNIQIAKELKDKQFKIMRPLRSGSNAGAAE